jgi:hypothetical protein
LPVNHAEVVIYPKAEHPVLNQEAFRTWQLIRLPKELAGGNNDVSAFRGCIAWYAFTSGARRGTSWKGRWTENGLCCGVFELLVKMKGSKTRTIYAS